ncbi:MAG: hypothetical protein B7X28_09250 [Halothiobacillus sp. 13-55-253]|nr:MAG: hypothetical protein B7X28_09250 [Halothiobacillus sp. 13-55-253]
MKKNILLVMALPQENVGNLLDQFGLPIIYTGVGKINAAIKLGEILSTTNEHTIVINLGSAGSHKYPRHTPNRQPCNTRDEARDLLHRR